MVIRQPTAVEPRLTAAACLSRIDGSTAQITSQPAAKLATAATASEAAQKPRR
jgi:hypothetical protein